MELTTSMRRKTMARQHKAEVMISGEQLRLRLHDAKLIKDRRYHLRTYPNCFIARELVGWLVSHREAPDRATAVSLMQYLMKHDIVHHVCDKRPVFKDAKLLYRFRRDDGTFSFNREVINFMRGQRLYEQLMGKDSILKLRKEKGVEYPRSVYGFQLIDWLLQNGEAESRRQGLELCRALQEHGILQHVTKKHDFIDTGLLYQFSINFRRRRRLSELLNNIDQDDTTSLETTHENNHHDSPYVICKNQAEKEISDFHSGGQSIDQTQGTNGNSLNFPHVNWTEFPPQSPASVVICNPKSVLKRQYVCEELLAPGAPFIKKVITVIGDDLGWGFVVRGRSPCYVQAVDPGGPAAAAGIKVRQFLYQINGRCVLYLDYRTITRMVMTGTRRVVLEVIESLE